jgi:hypothetical protein
VFVQEEEDGFVGDALLGDLTGVWVGDFVGAFGRSFCGWWWCFGRRFRGWCASVGDAVGNSVGVNDGTCVGANVGTSVWACVGLSVSDFRQLPSKQCRRQESTRLAPFWGCL